MSFKKEKVKVTTKESEFTKSLGSVSTAEMKPSQNE